MNNRSEIGIQFGLIGGLFWNFFIWSVLNLVLILEIGLELGFDFDRSAIWFSCGPFLEFGFLTCLYYPRIIPIIYELFEAIGIYTIGFELLLFVYPDGNSDWP